MNRGKGMRGKPIVILLLAFGLVSASMVLGQTLEDELNRADRLYREQDYQGALAAFGRVAKALEEENNMPGARQVRINIGHIHMQLGEYNQALREYEAARDLYPTPDRDIDVRLTRSLASAHHALGRYMDSAGLQEDLLQKYKDLDDATKAEVLTAMADSCRRAELYRRALGHYREAVAFYRQAGPPLTLAVILTAIGQCQEKLGEFDEAVKSLLEAMAVSRDLGHPANLAEIYSNLGIIHWELAEYSTALEYIAKAREVETKHRLKRNLGADLNNEGLIYKSVGDYRKALAAINRAMGIAVEISDRKSEAIALSNRALVNRILGQSEESLTDYRAALAMYEAIGFSEGKAGCYLGLGKLYETDRLDYPKALEYYRQALALYRQLDNISYQAETLIQIGRVLKKAIDPQRTTRDLIFSDSKPIFIGLSPEEARKQSLEAYREALTLSRKAARKEGIWSAEQGIGYALAAQGLDERAIKYYQQAINTVMGIRGRSDAELLGEYLRDKDDLFTEAMDLAARMYVQTRNPEYLRLQMEYQEIYRNEVLRNAMVTANVTPLDVDKADILKELKRLTLQREKLAQLVAALEYARDRERESDDPSRSRKVQELDSESAHLLALAEKLDGAIEELLISLRKQYPDEVGMFDSSAVVDIESIQAKLSDEQALVQYFPLPDRLSIICITNKEVTSTVVDISYRELARLIRDEFIHEQIEAFGHGRCPSEPMCYERCNQVMNHLYRLLIEPIDRYIADKSRLLIVPAKYLSYLPFSALVQGYNNRGEPRFLVYDKTISYIRLSFLDAFSSAGHEKPILDNARIIAVGDPYHDILRMDELPGALAEVARLKEVAGERNQPAPDIVVKKTATEDAWRELVYQGGYNVFYFATHSVPYAELLYILQQADRSLAVWRAQLAELDKIGDEAAKSEVQEKINIWESYVEFCRTVFAPKSPLFGFLYLSYSGKETDDGVLTLKEILELPDFVFSEARLAVLSACNTAVTYSPVVSEKLRRELEAESSIRQELIKAGWTPGVDQICLVDTFMKRNFSSVMGTLWFADDIAVGYLSSRFFENLDRYPPAEAMREAQLAYLKKPPLGPDLTRAPRHPYFWAVCAVFGR